MNAADTKAPCKSLAPKSLDPTVPTMQHTCHLSNSMPRVYDEGFPSIFWILEPNSSWHQGWFFQLPSELQ